MVRIIATLIVLIMSMHVQAERDSLATLKAEIEHQKLPGVHAVIIEHDGVRLAEWYFKGHDQTIGQDLSAISFNADTPHDVRLVTKSVVSMLFGIAHHDGLIPDLEQPIVSFFPEFTDLPSAYTADVKLRHVLSMTSGWNWDEFTYPYTDPRNSEIAMEFSDDPLKFVLTQPRVAEPGTHFTYSGGDVALVGAVIARAAKMPLDRYAEEKLFGPLGITTTEWSKRLDVPRAASGLRLTPNAMAKIGQLILHKGIHNARQLVPASWIQASTTQQIDIPSKLAPGSAYRRFWWLGEFEGQRWIGAFGNGGQRIWIVPERKLLVVTTMGLYDSPDQGRVPQTILATAIKATTSRATQ